MAPGVAPTMRLTSPAFTHQAAIPAEHTCDGDEASPELRWDGAPAGTKTFALIVDDPDAPDPARPKMTFVHWVLYNLPARSNGLPRAAGAKALPQGTREGMNDGRRTGYAGPCPPVGRHRYFFKLYALDAELPETRGMTKAMLEAAMQNHILASAELVGTYQRARH